MKIIDGPVPESADEVKSRNFGSLEQGEFFRWEGHYYCKPRKRSQNNDTCTCLCHGNTSTLYNEWSVYPLPDAVLYTGRRK